MLILDTNVVSALMQAEPDAAVTGWLDRQPSESIWTTTLTVFEVRFGLETLANGKKRKRLEGLFARVLQEGFEGRVLSFDAAAAEAAAVLAANRRKIGKTVDFRDTLIAGVVIARRARLATRNTRHFDDAGIKVINPWRVSENIN